MSENCEIIEISDSESIDSRTSSTDDSHRTMSSPGCEAHSESDEIHVIDDDSDGECECEFWDDDCAILNTEVTSRTIQGIHYVKDVSLASENKEETKRLKLSIEMNERFNDDLILDAIKEDYVKENASETKDYTLITTPWKVLVLHHFLKDVPLLEDVRQEFNKVAWNVRTMDLFEYLQSDDLKNAQEEHLMLMYDFLKGDMLTWVSQLTGLELVHVSATCSLYRDTDFLLVHDDQRGTRAIAFVLYLTGSEGWSLDWGGRLQLLNSDANKQPLDVQHSIVPQNNQLVLFPVSAISYHQVEEVQCKNYCRMSINGWFHTKEALTFEAPVYVPPTDGLYSIHVDGPLEIDVHLPTYIDCTYLTAEVIKDMNIHIEGRSELSLVHYFNDLWLKLILYDLHTQEIKWKRMGPPNRRNYHYISDDCTNEAPANVKELINLMRSRAFFHYLCQCTEMELTTMKWELQKWSKGSYSMLTLDNVKRLDVMICFGGDAHIVGGTTNYATLDDEVQTALISSDCESNTLYMVYGDAARYTTPISKYSTTEEFYVFFASYYEAFPTAISDENDDDDVKEEGCSTEEL